MTTFAYVALDPAGKKKSGQIEAKDKDALFTIGGDSTVPIVIWAQMRRGVSPAVNAISTLLLVTTVALVVATRKLTGATLAGKQAE